VAMGQVVMNPLIRQARRAGSAREHLLTMIRIQPLAARWRSPAAYEYRAGLLGTVLASPVAANVSALAIKRAPSVPASPEITAQVTRRREEIQAHDGSTARRLDADQRFAIAPVRHQFCPAGQGQPLLR